MRGGGGEGRGAALPGTARAHFEVFPAGPEPGRAAPRPGASRSCRSGDPGHVQDAGTFGGHCSGQHSARGGVGSPASRHPHGPPLAVWPRMGIAGTLRCSRPGYGRGVSKAGQAPVSRRSVGAPPPARCRPSRRAVLRPPARPPPGSPSGPLRPSVTDGTFYNILQLFHSVTVRGGGHWKACSLKGLAEASPGDLGPSPGTHPSPGRAPGTPSRSSLSTVE